MEIRSTGENAENRNSEKLKSEVRGVGEGDGQWQMAKGKGQRKKKEMAEER